MDAHIIVSIVLLELNRAPYQDDLGESPTVYLWKVENSSVLEQSWIEAVEPGAGHKNIRDGDAERVAIESIRINRAPDSTKKWVNRLGMGGTLATSCCSAIKQVDANDHGWHEIQ